MFESKKRNASTEPSSDIFFQVFVLSNRLGQGLRFSVTRTHVRIVQFLFALSLMVVALMSVDFVHLRKQAGSFNLDQVQYENEQLQQKKSELQVRLKAIENQLEDISKLNEKLTWIAQQSPESQSIIPAQFQFLTEKQNPMQPIADFDPSLFEEEDMIDMPLEARTDYADQNLHTVESQILSLMDHIYQNEHFLEIIPTIWPAHGWLSSYFGYRTDPFTSQRRFHYGLDIGAFTGTSVLATGGGIVRFAGSKAGYGEVVIIDHGYGLKTLYAHNSEVTVKRGDHVKRGQMVARLGSTGRSTGPHLHYEIRLHDQPVNPMQFILEEL